MTTIVLVHPDEHCPKFQVFGLYGNPNDHRTFAVQEFDERDEAERVARKMMEAHEADHFQRVIRSRQRIG